MRQLEGWGRQGGKGKGIEEGAVVWTKARIGDMKETKSMLDDVRLPGGSPKPVKRDHRAEGGKEFWKVPCPGGRGGTWKRIHKGN